jgi:hypothetical protein
MSFAQCSDTRSVSPALLHDWTADETGAEPASRARRSGLAADCGGDSLPQGKLSSSTI